MADMGNNFRKDTRRPPKDEEGRARKDRAKRRKAQAPLVKGVQGRNQALGNMDPQARMIADLKTEGRATNPNKGKTYGNIVRPGKAVTGSTSKQARRNFSPREMRVTDAKLNALRMLRESAAKGSKNSKDKLNRPKWAAFGNSGMRGGRMTGGMTGGGMNVNDLNR